MPRESPALQTLRRVSPFNNRNCGCGPDWIDCDPGTFPVSSAADLYESFRGRKTGRTYRIGVKFGSEWLTDRGRYNLIIPADLAVMGHAAAIEYDTTRDGSTMLARHEFARGSRPILAAAPGAGQIFLLGERFRWTDRGIMDIDRRGKLIDDAGLPRGP